MLMHHNSALDAVNLRRLVLEPREGIREFHLAAVLGLEEPEWAAAWQHGMLSVCAGTCSDATRGWSQETSWRLVNKCCRIHAKDAVMVSAGTVLGASYACGGWGAALLDELIEHNGAAACPDGEARKHREAPLGVAFEAPPRHVVGVGFRRRSDGVGMVVRPGADPAREASARGEAGLQAVKMMSGPQSSVITQPIGSRMEDA